MLAYPATLLLEELPDDAHAPKTYIIQLHL